MRDIGLGKELVIRVNPTSSSTLRSPPAASAPSASRVSGGSGSRPQRRPWRTSRRSRTC
ncbi:hypothetical protein [Tessaracoccus coleopterorum]|uniref:hypothetical protein n=1 Tax=Tessaracoccus coleopterorum TaxID=2714950 RepID=UPI0018D31DE3|nr:hypothetical protein [Tessaracoccus coleopterorum]